MTEPKLKADKEAGNLSETAKAELVKIYNFEKYGRRTEITNKYMDKGILAENDSIGMLSRLDDQSYSKNEEEYENDYIKGTPDVATISLVIDIKTSWSLDTFQSYRHKEVNRDHYYQILGYMALTGAKYGQICYCLTNTPESVLNGEKYSLLRRMDVVTEEDPRYVRAISELEFNHTFDDIPINERVITVQYDFDYNEIIKVYEKVKKARIWLQDFDKLVKYGNLQQNTA
jgi:hypothetical protein